MTASTKIYFNSNDRPALTPTILDMSPRRPSPTHVLLISRHANLDRFLSKLETRRARKTAKSGLKDVTTNRSVSPTYSPHDVRALRHGVRLEVSPQAISVWYDKDKVLAAVAKDDSPRRPFRPPS